MRTSKTVAGDMTQYVLDLAATLPMLTLYPGPPDAGRYRNPSGEGRWRYWRGHFNHWTTDLVPI